jgi:hypothetical protein
MFIPFLSLPTGCPAPAAPRHFIKGRANVGLLILIQRVPWTLSDPFSDSRYIVSTARNRAFPSATRSYAFAASANG